jgi:peptide/nickel transport system substrate-binding protein
MLIRRSPSRDRGVTANGGAHSGPDPDQVFEFFYGCGSKLNWDGYCNPEIGKLIEQQSSEANQERRKQLVWTIERKLAEDVARPIIFYNRVGTCWQPYVKGLTIMVNSIFNGNRREDIWLDK